MRILFDSKKTEYKKPFGTLNTAETCELNIKIPEACATKKVFAVFEDGDGNEFCSYSMFKSQTLQGYETYSCKISFAAKGLYFYYFYIETEGSDFPLYKQGYDQTNIWEGDKWQLSVIPEDFVLPEKFYGRVMYQIFPDRFYFKKLCKTDGKMTPFTLHADTADVPEYRPNAEGEITNSDFFGGNLAGITDKLDYLKDLGVGVIYLNPIFKAYSNHRYDTCDYKKIDELLGNEKDFARLCREAHKRDMYVILDGVFSHTGSDSVYFDALNRFGNGACSNPDSPYRAWYDFQSYPDKYTSWWGIETLPCVNELEQSYIEYQITNADSTVNKWLSLGADGFRLDVADELPEEFIRILRAEMKKHRPDALLLGEVWEDASNKISYGCRRRYFLGEELDSVMNYPFRNAIIAFVLSRDNGEELRDTVMSIAENYPPKVLPLLMNFLSTHDTQRIFTVLGEGDADTKDERAVYKLPSEKALLAEQRLKCAVFIQYVLPGIPSIFYGDEIYQQGFEDPFCRGFFDWNEKRGMRELLKSLAKIKKHPAVKSGAVEVEVLSAGIVSIKRTKADKTLTAYVNCSDGDFAVSVEGKRILVHNAENNVIKRYGFILVEK